VTRDGVPKRIAPDRERGSTVPLPAGTCSPGHAVTLPCPTYDGHGTLRPHTTYARNVVDVDADGRVEERVEELDRVICDDCNASHALIPTYLIP